MSSDDDPHESFQRGGGVTAVVLAAGRGTRMKSELPKVLHPIAGRAIAAHVLHAVAEAGVCEAVVVVAAGAAGAKVREALAADIPEGLELRFAVQEQPRGTGDAMLAARTVVHTEQVLIVNGDLALLSPEQTARMLEPSRAAASVAVGTVGEPAKMGRVVRDEQGKFVEIVEWADATEEQREGIHEVNAGVYRYRTEWLWRELERAACSDGEEHHGTDAVSAAAAAGELENVTIGLAEGRLNVEDLTDAARAAPVLWRRIAERHAGDGVELRDVSAVWIEAGVEIAAGAIIEPGVHLRGRTRIGAGSRIGPGAVLEDVAAGEGCVLESCTIRDSELGDRVEVGPYSIVRPGCRLGDGVHIGSHAELKTAELGRGVQMGHFSYVGDAALGDRVNVGAGAVTCNFDGIEKHRTEIGEDAFIGSGTMLVPPLKIGARARTGAGSVVTKDVPDDGVAVGHPARLAPSRRTQREGS